jgi:hypothetical protein
MTTPPLEDRLDPVDRLDALEARLRALEDERAITMLVASYGPLVDAGEADRVAALWTEDGVYDVDELFMGSRAEIDAMVRSEAHQGLLARGCCHFLGPAHVSIDGDRAVAVCESVLLVRHEGRVVVARIGANRWELVRTGAGWRTTRRTTRALDGRAETRALLAATDPTD